MSILDRTENVSNLENVGDTNAMQMSIVVVDRAVSFLRSLSVIESDDQQHLMEFSTRSTTTDCTGRSGRPSFKISMEML